MKKTTYCNNNEYNIYTQTTSSINNYNYENKYINNNNIIYSKSPDKTIQKNIKLLY